MDVPDPDVLEERGRVFVSLLSLADASDFAAEREARRLDPPLRRFDELLSR